MNIVQELVTRKIADNVHHAAGILNVLECYKLETDEQRIERCELYKAWCEYYKEPKKGGGFKISKENKQFARAHAIAGDVILHVNLAIPTNSTCVIAGNPVPMLEKESEKNERQS